MKILKYVKDKNNVYKVYIDSEIIKLYDDIISRYNLLFKTEIDEALLDEIIKENAKLDSYYLSIKYINKKLRSKKEIEEYLVKKEFNKEVIKETIKRLVDNKFINDEIYLKCYINDQINLSNNGPLKIKKNLINLGLEVNLIEEALAKINSDVWNNKIDLYIDKKIKLNHTNSAYMLKVKMKNDLINLGYLKEDIENILTNKNIDDKDNYQKEYEKAKKSLEKKYSGYELEMKIKEKLYRKGFKVNSYEE